MEDLSLHILDIAENSIAASAKTIEIKVDEDWAEDLLTIEIIDNGSGMDEQTREKATDPFFTTRTTRRVGLGLSLLAQAAKDAGGEMQLRSTPAEGTVVKATFRLSHPDCKPMGNIAATINTLTAGHPDINIVYEYKNDDLAYRFDTRETDKT